MPADDRAGRPGAAREQPQHELAAQGVPGEVVVAQAQVIDEGERVVGEDVRRVARRVVRPPAVPVPAQVRGDDPVAPPGQGLGQRAAEDQRPAAHQPVQQDHGPPVAGLPPGQLDAVAAAEPPRC
jgi:hypothetical protein